MQEPGPPGGGGVPVEGLQRRREPNFFVKGKAGLVDAFKEAANYRQLKRTPYGLKPLIVFLILGAVSGFDGTIFTVAIPEIVQETEIDFIPLIQALQLVGIFLAIAFFGIAYYADRGRRLPLVGVGMIINGIFSLLTANASTVRQFGLLRGGDALGGRIQSAPQGSLIADYYPPESRGKAIAFNFTFGTAVGLMSLFVAGKLIGLLGWRNVFRISGPLVIAGGIAVMFLLKEPVRGYMERRSLGLPEEEARKPEPPPSVATAWRTMWSIRTYRRSFIAGIPAGLGASLLPAILATFYLERYGLDVEQRVLISAAIGAVVLPFGFLGGGLADVLIRRRPDRLLILVGVVGLLGPILLVFQMTVPPLWILLALAVLSGAFGALVAPALAVVNFQIIPAHMRTMGAAVFTIAAVPQFILNIFVLEFAERLGGDVVTIVAIAAPLEFIGALILLSAAPLFERDLRNALASQAATLEYQHALSETEEKGGRPKILVCRELDVEYDGVQVLFGLDFDLEDGQILALLGTNGAGKSTLLRAISGSQEASSGAILFGGRDITHLPTNEIAALGITHMPGGRGIFPDMTVRENLALATWLCDEKEAKEGLRRVFDMFPVLEERAGTRAILLSGGEQQQLSLAQAFLSKPKLLLIDELSLGLSPVIVEQLIKAVREIHAQGTTVVLVEQSVNIALTVADQAIFMEKGEVKFSGATRDLLSRPDIMRAVYVKGTGALTGAPAGALRTARETRRMDLQEAPVLLDVKNLSKSYGGVSAVDDVSFGLREGEILGLIGPNGAGKTTVFDLISGYQLPDSGQILFNGADVGRLRADERAKRRMVRRFQDARLFPSLTVFENLLIALDRKLQVKSAVLTVLQVPQVRRAERVAQRRAEALIDLLDLGGSRDKFVKELSTGLRRIVDLACVLATEPKLLLLDEPSTGIAQAETESLGPLLRRVRFETGASILIIEHDMNLISTIADELIAMVQGRIVMRGQPEEVLNDEIVISSYLGTSEEAIQRSGLVT